MIFYALLVFLLHRNQLPLDSIMLITLSKCQKMCPFLSVCFEWKVLVKNQTYKIMQTRRPGFILEKVEYS